MTEFLDWLRSVVPMEVKRFYWAAEPIYLSPWFYLGIGLILVMEWVRPARREQAPLSPGLVQDFLWFNLDLAFKVAALPALAGLLQLGYTRITGGFSLGMPPGWPVWATVLVSFLAFDFLQWFHHWVRHKVTPFWHLHVIHHSQRELNPFTDLRIHFGEYLIARTIEIVPMMMFGLTPFLIMGMGAATTWYTRFIHANIRTNLGPVGWLLVSPQYHRIHHSIEERHHDTNFGVILTVWDRAFGTAHRERDTYPATGLPGVDFPAPSSRSASAWVGSFVEQLVYPFRQIMGRHRE